MKLVRHLVKVFKPVMQSRLAAWALVLLIQNIGNLFVFYILPSYVLVKIRAILRGLFKLFWSVEKHDTNPANSGMIGLAKSVKSVLICG